MEFFEAVQKRRSVRRFKPTPVPEEIVKKAIQAALLAPNSSNMQPWEFYWVKSEDKKTQLKKACLSQPAATTASELVVAVSRLDTWKRNRRLMLEHFYKDPKTPKSVFEYYGKLMPVIYTQDPFGIIGIFKFILVTIVGLFRPIPRGPNFKSELFEVVTKTTALACENFMLAIVAQGYGCCPMEGFDESMVKKILKLNRHCHVVMVLGVGETDPKGVFGPQLRFDEKLFIYEV